MSVVTGKTASLIPYLKLSAKMGGGFAYVLVLSAVVGLAALHIVRSTVEGSVQGVAGDTDRSFVSNVRAA